MSTDPEVRGIGDIVRVQALAVEPLVTAWHTVHEPAVADHWIQQRNIPAQPELALVLSVDDGRSQLLFAVDVDPQQRLAHATCARHAQPHRNRVAQFGSKITDIGPRTVVMGHRPSSLHPHRQARLPPSRPFPVRALVVRAAS